MENELDAEGDGNGYSGTFRWKRTKILKQMPPLPRDQPVGAFERDISKLGWGSYLSKRGESLENSALSAQTKKQQFIQFVQSDLSIIDCISPAVSVGFMVHSVLGMDFCANSKLTVVCLGCSDKAEERILRETNCWLELLFCLPHIPCIDLWLVGPEISTTTAPTSPLVSHSRMTAAGSNRQEFSAFLYQGTAIDFFRAYPDNLSSGGVVVFGLNCGFGNFSNPLPARYDLFFSWIPDLFFLTGTRLPIFFTCANNHEDLIGEVSIMHKLLGTKFIALPNENPFSFASTLIPPATSASASRRQQQQQQQQPSESIDFSRGNSYFYGVQSFDKARRRKFDFKMSNANRLSEFLKIFQSSSSISLSSCLVEPVRISPPVISVSTELAVLSAPSPQPLEAAVPEIEISESSPPPEIPFFETVDNRATQLTATFDLTKLIISSIVDVELSLNLSGDVIRLGISDREFRFRLSMKVKAATMQAKFSKKKKILAICADIQGN